MTKKPQPLDLEEKELLKKFGYNEDLDLSPLASNIGFAFNDSLKELIKEIKQRLKSACKFYLKYWRNPGLLIKEHPEHEIDVLKLRRDAIFEVNGFVEDAEQIEGPFAALYIEWLFKLAFKDVLEEGSR